MKKKRKRALGQACQILTLFLRHPSHLLHHHTPHPLLQCRPTQTPTSTPTPVKRPPLDRLKAPLRHRPVALPRFLCRPLLLSMLACNMSAPQTHVVRHLHLSTPTSAYLSVMHHSALLPANKPFYSFTGSSSSVSRQVTSPSSGRRRSQVLMNLQLNDPSLPGPGEMVPDANHRSSFTSPVALSGSPLLMAGGDPHHARTPSLGELHQELEAEQEAQVVRHGILFRGWNELLTIPPVLESSPRPNPSPTSSDPTASISVYLGDCRR